MKKLNEQIKEMSDEQIKSIVKENTILEADKEDQLLDETTRKNHQLYVNEFKRRNLS